MGATWRPWVNDSDAPANGEASNNAIEVARNWRRCIDLEFIGEAQRGTRSGLSDSFILSSTAESTATRRGRPRSSSKDFSSVVRHKVPKVTCFWVVCVCKISGIDLGFEDTKNEQLTGRSDLSITILDTMKTRVRKFFSKLHMFRGVHLSERTPTSGPPCFEINPNRTSN